MSSVSVSLGHWPTTTVFRSLKEIFLPDEYGLPTIKELAETLPAVAIGLPPATGKDGAEGNLAVEASEPQSLPAWLPFSKLARRLSNDAILLA